MSYIPCKAAYGVQLNSKKEVREHYDANKDFENLSMYHRGSYINKQDSETFSMNLEIRYGKNGTKVMIINANGEEQ